MLKYLHIFLAALVFIGFTGRVILAEFNPRLLQKKWLKLSPHVIDSFLLFSGIALFIHGHRPDADYDWLIAKGLILIAYISLGMLSLRSNGRQRLLAASAAIACLILIAKIAVTKKIFAFF